MIKNVIAIVAHPDDEIIGVGGALRKHIKAGDKVRVLILGDGKTSRDTIVEKNKTEVLNVSLEETAMALKILGISSYQRLSLPDNKFDSLPLLDIVKKVSNFISAIKPDVVYTHHFGDLNIDHKLTFEATIIACRPIEINVNKILLFETLSSTEMSGHQIRDVFLPNYFINIENELEDKLNATSQYASELCDFPHPRSIITIRENAHVWGSKVNLKAAEAFELFRYIEK
ncbi:MAG TPA: PIG-L family deacetylase [Candidatus Paceibacterota bacterium]